MSRSAKDQITQQLTRFKHTRVGHNIFICCPFPEHKDSTPSFSVYVGRVSGTANSMPLGFGYCWGCGRKADWKKIAELLNLDARLNGDIYAETLSESQKDLLLPKRLTMDSLLLKSRCEGEHPIELREWRTIPRKLLSDIGCFYTDKLNIVTDENDEVTDIKRHRILFLPCFVKGNLVGGVRANLRKVAGKNSYYNTPGNWVLTKGYFCFDYSHNNFDKTMPIIVGEGSRDALSWVRDGYPAVAILGSKVFSKEKARLLVSLGRPIIPFFDGDGAGIKASNLVCDTLKEVLGDRYADRVKPYNTVRRAMRILGKDRSEVEEMEIDPANLPPEMRKDFIRFYNKFWKG